MSEQVRCTPTSSIGELPSSYVHPLHGNPYSSRHIYHLASLAYDCPHWCEPFLFFFVFLLLRTSLFAILSVNSRAYAHPLHECSKYWKRSGSNWLVPRSGLVTNQDKIPEKDQVWNFSRLSSQQINIFFSYSLSPFLHANTIWRHSSHVQREPLHLMFFCYLFQC